MRQTEQVLGNRYQRQQQLGNNAAHQTWLTTDIKLSPASPVAQKNTPKGRKSAIYITVLQYIFYVFVFPIVLLGCDYRIKESRESEVRKNISILNRAQEAYFLEFNDLADSSQKLNIKIKNENQTEKYDYSMRIMPLAVFNYATPRTEGIHGYVGAVFLVSGVRRSDPRHPELLTRVIYCKTKTPGKKRAAEPIVRGNRLECNPDTASLGNKDDTARIVLDKDSASAYNCLSYTTAGQYDKSLEVAQTINDGWWKARVLATIAIKIAEKGQYDKAVEVTKTIKDDYSKQIALSEIARLIRFQNPTREIVITK